MPYERRIQRSNLPSDQKLLQEHSSPISRCPVDILKCIFEATIEKPDFPYKSGTSLTTATCLSRVCRKWRAICFDTPRLWSICRMTCAAVRGSISREMIFWERVLALVKSVPMIIRIAATSTVYPYWSIRIDKVPVIERLELHCSEHNYDIISNSTLPLPKNTLNELYISQSWLYENTISTRDVDKLLHRFPPIRSFYLHIGGKLHMSGHVYTSIHTLSIRHAQEMNPLLILASLPRLQRLKFQSVNSIQITTTASVKLAHLKSLGLGLVYSIAWLTSIDCPNLEEFAISHPTNPNDILNFISSHRSILSLIYRGYRGDLPRLASVAPQLQHLCLSCLHLDLSYLSDGMFSSLNSLTLLDHGLPMSKFDALVKSRFLPLTHRDSQLVAHLEPIETLQIFPYLIPENSWRLAGYWYESILIQDTTYDDSSTAYLRTLSWV